MKKIMLVDDEILIRENIRQRINWNREGFIYCGDAADGEMALPLIEEWQPQILITDIKMPFMDGLELSSIVRKKYPFIKIIILSGHDEFHYAQRALQIGVEDYCLKPIGADDLVELLHKMSKRIDEEELHFEKAKYSREKFLADLCGGLIKTSEAIELSPSFSISLIACYYAVIIVDTVESNDSFFTIQDEEQQLESLLTSTYKALHYKRSRSETVWIFQESELQVLQQTLQQVQNLIKQHTPVLLERLIGVGGIYERVSGIHHSYLEADQDKSIQRLKAFHKVESLLLTNENEYEPIVLDRAKWIHFVKVGNSLQLQTFIHEFASELQHISWHSSVYGIYLMNELTLEAFQAAKQVFLIEDSTHAFMSSRQQLVKQIKNMDDCKSYLQSLIEWLWRWRAVSSNQYGELIMNVQHYISSHISNNQLSLQNVAKHVGVSPSHLSKIYSQETKQTLTEFITQTRINKAKELLKTTNYKTFEIAFEVGYQDQHYFSNTFKKVTKMTPIEFRKHGNSPSLRASFSNEGAQP